MNEHENLPQFDAASVHKPDESLGVVDLEAECECNCHKTPAWGPCFSCRNVYCEVIGNV